MKSKLMMLSVAVVMSLSVFAQGGQKSKGSAVTPAEKNKQRVEQMDKAVGLTADEKVKVEALFNENSAEISKLRKEKPADMKEKSDAMRKEQDAKLKAIIGADRYTKYHESLKKEAELKKGEQSATPKKGSKSKTGPKKEGEEKSTKDE